MKSSKSLLVKSVIFSILSILAFLPGHLFYISQQKVIDEAIHTYNLHGAIADSIVSDGLTKKITKNIEGFDFDSLNDLGEKINVNFEELTSQMKKPYGSTFLSSVQGLAIIAIVKQLAKSIIHSNLSKQFIFSILSLIIYICILITYLWLFQKRKISVESERTSSIKIINIILIHILLALVVYCTYIVLPICFKAISSPHEIHFSDLNYTIGPFITVLSCILGLLILYFIYYHYLRFVPKIKLTSIMLIISFLTITYNVGSFSNFLNLLNTSIVQQNLSTSRQLTIYNCTRLSNYTRQWHLSNLDENEVSSNDFSLSAIDLPEDIDPELFSFEVKDDLIIFSGKMINAIEKDTVEVAQSFYYSDADSISSKFVSP